MAAYTMPLLSNHYVGSFVLNQTSATTHYLTATQDGFSVDMAPNADDVITDELGAIPLDAINQGVNISIKTTLQRYDEAYWHSTDTYSIRTSGSRLYTAKEAGLFFGADHNLPGGHGNIGTPISATGGGILTLSPYSSTGTLTSSLANTIVVPIAIPVPGSFQLNTKLAKWEITFRAMPYWDSILGIWRSYYLTGGIIS